MLARVRKFPFLLAFFLLCHFAVFFLPFSVWQNAELFLLIAALNGILYLPNMLQNRAISGHFSLHDPIDTLSNKGVPFYSMGKFVRFLEI